MKQGKSISVTLVALYAVLMGLALIVGVFSPLSRVEGFPENAVRMPGFALFIGVVMAVAGIGLFCKINISRHVFLVAAPLASIALGSAYAHVMWHEDAPYTIVAILFYVPLAFLISRGGALSAVGAKNGKWLTRGGALMLGLVIVMLMVRMVVGAIRPASMSDLFSDATARNDYEKLLVISDLCLWNFIFGFVAVSIPTRFRTSGSGQPLPPASSVPDQL